MFLFYVAQSEDEHGRPARKRGPVGFDQDVRSDVSHSVAALFFFFYLFGRQNWNVKSSRVLLLQVDKLRQAVRNLKSEQNRLTGELEREREDRTRLV